MYCRNCGTRLQNQAVACTGCGFPPLRGTNHCQTCGKSTVLGQAMCTSCGSSLGSGQSSTSKSRVTAGILAIFLGFLGVHKFYLGYKGSGVIMLLLSLLGGIITCSVSLWVMWIIAIIEGILYITKTDAEFETSYVVATKDWF